MTASDPAEAGSTEEPQEAEEGGVVEGANQTTTQPRDVGTRQLLTYVIIGLLGTTFFFHYVSIAWLIDPKETTRVAAVQKIFDVWLPVIAGLAGSAATYFYTRGGR